MRKFVRLAGFACVVAVLTIGSTGAHAQFVQGQQAAIYPDPSGARGEITAALEKARAEHKNVILDFGGNWCGDCKVLNFYFHQEPNADLLEKNFVLVDINIGRYDRDLGHYEANTDLGDHYGVALAKGVPALAVLDAHGRLLYSQKNGEFESMRKVDPSAVTDFLNQWKPRR